MTLDPEGFAPAHFHWGFDDGVATVTLNRPDRKNPQTFESYAELRDLFRQLVYTPAVKAVVLPGAGGNFRWGGSSAEPRVWTGGAGTCLLRWWCAQIKKNR